MASFFNYYYCSQLVVLLTILSVSNVIGNVQVIKYVQKLDHFGREKQLSNHTFQQTLVVDDSKWAGAKARAPIIVLLGELDVDIDPKKLGIFSLAAPEFKAMLVMIEHRFYGTSIPLGSIDLALADHKIRGCLSIEQTLEDFNVIISNLKSNYSAHHSPVIVMGRGYGGALATWFRLKFPQMTVGALVSSTPLLYYGSSSPGDGYCDVVSNDYKEFDQSCYKMISASWKIIDDYASQPNGLAKLSQSFNSCRPLQSVDELKIPLAIEYSVFRQFDGPKNHETRLICQNLEAEEYSVDGFFATLQQFMTTMGGTCFNSSSAFFENFVTPFQLRHRNLTSSAWEWQRCSELMLPIGCSKKTMLPSSPFDMAQFKQTCQKNFGVVPQSKLQSNYYKNHSVEDYLTKYGTNFIFSNGLKDPYSSGAIMNNLSDTITAITPADGGYYWDFFNVNDDDPEWLKEHRAQELNIIRQWMTKKSHHISKSSSRRASNFTIYFVELNFIFYLYLAT